MTDDLKALRAAAEVGMQYNASTSTQHPTIAGEGWRIRVGRTFLRRGINEGEFEFSCTVTGETEESMRKDGLQRIISGLGMVYGMKKLPEERDGVRDAALSIAKAALEKIGQWCFGWDGDCGVTKAADDALAEIDAAMAAQQGGKGGE